MESVLLLLLSFFAVYGILQLTAKALFSVRSEKRCRTICDHRLIGVRDCAESIEGLVRTLSWQDLREELIVLNFGALDETEEVLRHLEEEFDFLRVMTPKEYQDYLSLCEDTV